MIAYIKGDVTEYYEDTVVIECGGIGYEVFISNRDLENLYGYPKDIKIYIFEHIKEDAKDLYGFCTIEEKRLFKKLISISGIGPKAGIAMLNMYGANELIEIIVNGDTKALGKVTGIGPKTASRVVLELKDSIAKFMAIDENRFINGIGSGAEKTSGNSDAKAEAIEALESLGYTAAEAKKAVKAIAQDGMTTEELIKKAFTLMSM